LAEYERALDRDALLQLRDGPPVRYSGAEKLKEFLTAKPASYSEKEEPRRAEKEQMSAPQEELMQDKPQPSKSKEK
jgi:hypothetical protein